jgi:hypothetical protein
MAIVMILGFSAVFLMRSVSEKRFADVEKFVMQADFLAESGANHALSELRERIRVDLEDEISDEASSEEISQYCTDNEPLEFLRDYAYASGDDQFTVNGDEATLDISSITLRPDQVDGDYNAQVIITSNGDPTSPTFDTYVFYYNYKVVGNGTSSAITPNISRAVNLAGSFTVTVMRDTFASYALFTNDHRTPSGGLVWFTGSTNFTGPVHTNSRFSFKGNPSGRITGEATQHDEEARFWNNGNNILLDADSNPPRDVPTFDVGFQRDVDEIDLPSAIEQQDLKDQALGGISEPGGEGVYVPNDSGNVVGGIFIKGDANVNMDKDNIDAENKAIIIATQGASTTTITIEYAHDPTPATTQVQVDGGPIDVYQGVPDGIDNEGVIIYGAKDEGNSGELTISDLADNNVVVQKRTKMTISCEDDIIIQDHIRYQEYDTLPSLNALAYENQLGILAWGEDSDVRIGTSAPNNLDIHGIVMSEEGVFKVDNYDQGPNRGVVTLLGGAITNFYGTFGSFSGSGYGRRFIYDARTNLGVIPPYFPILEFFTSSETGLSDRPFWSKS